MPILINILFVFFTLFNMNKLYGQSNNIDCLIIKYHQGVDSLELIKVDFVILKEKVIKKIVKANFPIKYQYTIFDFSKDSIYYYDSTISYVYQSSLNENKGWSIPEISSRSQIIENTKNSFLGFDCKKVITKSVILDNPIIDNLPRKDINFIAKIPQLKKYLTSIHIKYLPFYFDIPNYQDYNVEVNHLFYFGNKQSKMFEKISSIVETSISSEFLEQFNKAKLISKNKFQKLMKK